MFLHGVSSVTSYFLTGSMMDGRIQSYYLVYKHKISQEERTMIRKNPGAGTPSTASGKRLCRIDHQRSDCEDCCLSF